MGAQHPVLLVGGSRNVLEDAVEQRLQVGGVGHPTVLGLVEGGASGLGGGVDDRDVEQGGVIVLGKIHEEVVGLLDDIVDASVGAVDLVEDEDEWELLGQGLAQHEAGLGEGALGGIDEEDDAVDHLEATLDLTAEISVSGGVDDVEGDLLAVAHDVLDSGVLGENGDALLALEVHRVHDAFLDLGALTEGSRLPQHRVDQRGLSVVNVGHDGDVAQILAYGHAELRFRSRMWTPRRGRGTSAGENAPP